MEGARRSRLGESEDATGRSDVLAAGRTAPIKKGSADRLMSGPSLLVKKRWFEGGWARKWMWMWMWMWRRK